MKFRILAIIFTAFFLSACTFSLAEDVTPPPNYVPPTPMPTLGPMFPAEAPSIENGKAIYAEKCAACHGPAGMGDGNQGKQLPVTVTAFGLPQVARAAVPFDWYTIITRGNMERSMPAFASLTDQERWDVVAYALTLHITPEQIALGKLVYESVCTGIPNNFFANQEAMARISETNLASTLQSACKNPTAPDNNTLDEDLLAAAAYLRTLTFATPSPTPEPAAMTPTVSASEATPSAPPLESTTPVDGQAGTPSVEGTPLGTESITPSTLEASGGKVTGSISGENPAGQTVTLRGYDHAPDASGPQEVVTLTAVTDAGGNYIFEGLEMPIGRIYLAEVAYQGVTYRSESAVVEAGMTELLMQPFKLFETTSNSSALAFDQVHFFFDITEGTVQVIGVYTFSNKGEKTIVIKSTTDIPFLKMPEDAKDVGFELTQDSAPLIAAVGGFAIQPSETPYGMVAFYTLPYDKKGQIVQPFALPASSVLVLIPDGVKLKSDQLTEGEMQNFQGRDYREYIGGAMKSGDTLTLNLSGMPRTTGTTGSNSRQNLLIGIGALGLVLILAGTWMYLRDRNRPDEELEEPEEEVEFDSEEEILDAIIALDDLHRAGKIPDETYQARRAELKARLKA